MTKILKERKKFEIERSQSFIGHFKRKILKYNILVVLMVSDVYYPSKKSDDFCEDVCGEVPFSLIDF